MATLPPLQGTPFVVLKPMTEVQPGRKLVIAVLVPVQGFPVVTL
jgi:hypothetical protein